MTDLVSVTQHLDLVVEGAAEKVLYHPVLKLVRSGRLSQSEFVRLSIQRHLVTASFIPLLMSGIEKARERGKIELAKVLESNLKDELGETNRGLCRELSHAIWRKHYLRALGVRTPHIANALKGTSTYCQAISKLIMRVGNLYDVAGAILLLEYIIPREFEAYRVCRDQLFAAQFVVRDTDDAETQRTKSLACRYLDDHIWHDKNFHYPDLLAVLRIPQERFDAIALMDGIGAAEEAKVAFYNSLGESFDP